MLSTEWQFHISIINITYKPWRLYVILCALPGLLSCIILTFLPESPKFVLGQGDQTKTYEILQQMNRINNGPHSQLESFVIYEEPESIENRQRILNCKNDRFPLISSIWIQTAPLFNPTYRFQTILICFIQFCIFTTMNGFFMFSAEILNKMATNLNDYTNERVMMCEVINMESRQPNATHDTIGDKVFSCLRQNQRIQTFAKLTVFDIRFASLNLN